MAGGIEHAAHAGGKHQRRGRAVQGGFLPTLVGQHGAVTGQPDAVGAVAGNAVRVGAVGAVQLVHQIVGVEGVVVHGDQQAVREALQGEVELFIGPEILGAKTDFQAAPFLQAQNVRQARPAQLALGDPQHYPVRLEGLLEQTLDGQIDVVDALVEGGQRHHHLLGQGIAHAGGVVVQGAPVQLAGTLDRGVPGQGVAPGAQPLLPASRFEHAQAPLARRPAKKSR
ncbi:MAG: hypothetical protein CL543_08210 [Alcanivorax sp.]|nr:hypothetical protein [Alcanivorax sp.]